MTPLEHVIRLLKDRGAKTKQLNAAQWEAQCPAHDDSKASLSLGEGSNQKLLLHCHAGCDLDLILTALGITKADLFPTNGQKKSPGEIVATYDYQDAAGTLLFQVVKKTGKEFRQRRPDGGGGWIWNLEGVTRVPYRLPELLDGIKAGKAVFIVEGEKDVDRLRSLGLTATTTPGGAGKWRPEYQQWFEGAGRIYVLPDNDKPGRDHARDVAQTLGPQTELLKIVGLFNLQHKEDISDWLDKGHTLDELRDVIKATLPWQSVSGSVDLTDVLQEVFDWFGRFVAYPTEHDQLAHTLWTVHTHAMECWESTPRLAFLSPEPASGKSRALEVTEPLVPNPVQAINVTPAYLFRKVGEEGSLPTILYDEIDTVFGPKAKDNEEIRGLLNAGHRRGAVAGRCVVLGKVVKTEEIPAYSPVALAGLGEIPDTILTRSIAIKMRRRAFGEYVEPYRIRDNTPEGERLRDRIAAALSEIKPILQAARPEMPLGIEDRDADKWEPLLAIADTAGGDWPRRARAAVVALVELSQESTPSLGVRLLADLRTIFTNHEVMTTEMILKALIAIEEAPWGDLYGKPLNARGLAQRLQKYDIPKSKTVRIGDLTAKGYARSDFWDAWTRYLPDVTDVTDVTDSYVGGPSDDPLSPNTSISNFYDPQGGKVTSVTNVTFDDYEPDPDDLADPFEGD